MGVQDAPTSTTFMNGMKALTDIGEHWNIPTVVCDPWADFTIGPIFDFILTKRPNAIHVNKHGVTSCFDLKEFRDVIASFGVNKLIISGLSLDINVMSAAISAKNLGYEVYVVVDACGTFSKDMREISMARMVQAGIIPITWFALGGELMNDWLSQEG